MVNEAGCFYSWLVFCLSQLVLYIHTVKKLNDMKKYEFTGIRFVPGYNDFDQDWFECEAENEEEAWKELDKYTKMWTWKSVKLIKVSQN